VFGGFRFLLAQLVVLGHLWPERRGTSHIYAVFGFYVLSGYLMSLVLERVYGHSPQGTLRFFANRALRIYPPYWVALALGLLGLYLLPEAAARTSRYMGLPANALEWLQNVWIFGLQGGQRPRVVPPAWSLDVELCLYVAMALLLARTRWTIALWLGASLAITVYLVASGAPFLERYAPPAAASLPFALGAALQRLLPALPATPAPVALAAVALFATHAVFPTAIVARPALTGFYLALVLAVLAVAALRGVDPRRAPDWLRAADRALGDLAYPVFLLHWAAAVYLVAAGLAGAWPRGLDLWWKGALVTTALAWLLHRAVERPIESLRDALRGRRAEAQATPRAEARAG
jgi:peptidoglycan/LPS O-acetylase OafA/YrhL